MWYENFFGNCPLPAGLNEKKLAKFENDIEFQNCFAFLLTNCMDIFEWDLPKTCDPRFLELSLIYRGCAVMPVMGDNLFNLMASPAAERNIYGNPLKSYGYGLNGFNEEFKLYTPGADDSKIIRKSVSGITMGTNYDAVFVRDNEICYPYVNYLITAAKRMANAMRSIDVATLNLKQPAIITCEESYKTAVDKILSDTYQNKPAIVATKGFNSKFAEFGTIDLKSDPAILSALWESYDKLDSVIKSQLGIDSISNVNKKAQMLSGEVSQNNQALEYSLEKRLKCRQQACDDIEKAFGIKCSVKIKHEIEQDAFIPEDASAAGGEDNNVQLR